MPSDENDAEHSNERRRTSMHREGEGRVVARRRERNDAVEQGTGDASSNAPSARRQRSARNTPIPRATVRSRSPLIRSQTASPGSTRAKPKPFSPEVTFAVAAWNRLF